MDDFKITRQIVPTPGGEQISESVRRRIAASMNNLIESSIMGTMTSTAEPVAPQEPLTLKSMALSMARAMFNAEIIISEYAPKETTDKDGVTTTVAAFRIDNTQLPDWDMRCAIAKARGEPAPNPTTIVFPSVEKAIEAVAMASTRK